MDKIEFLENQLKLKELEISNLREQLKLKDTIINILSNKSLNENEKQPNETTEQISSKQIKEYLNKSRPNALPFEKFIKNELYRENEYFKIIVIKNNKNNKEKNIHYFNGINCEAIIPNTINGLFNFSSLNDLIVNVICSIIKNTNKILCPLYCSDSHRNIFYVNTDEEGWKRMTSEEFEPIIHNLISIVERTANIAEFNAYRIFKYLNDTYYSIYPNGIKNADAFDSMRTTQKIILLTEITPELKNIISKHLKSKLSQILEDKKPSNIVE